MACCRFIDTRFVESVIYLLRNIRSMRFFVSELCSCAGYVDCLISERNFQRALHFRLYIFQQYNISVTKTEFHHRAGSHWNFSAITKLAKHLFLSWGKLFRFLFLSCPHILIHICISMMNYGLRTMASQIYAAHNLASININWWIISFNDLTAINFLTLSDSKFESILINEKPCKTSKSLP